LPNSEPICTSNSVVGHFSPKDRTDLIISVIRKPKRHDYTIGTLDVLKACDACADMGQLVQCTDCVVFPSKLSQCICEVSLCCIFIIVPKSAVCCISCSTLHRSM